MMMQSMLAARRGSSRIHTLLEPSLQRPEDKHTPPRLHGWEYFVTHYGETIMCKRAGQNPAKSTYPMG